MDLNAHTSEENNAVRSEIIQYQLILDKNGNRHRYIWCQHPHDAEDAKRIAILIDLNNIHMPDIEVERMLSGFLVPAFDVISIAFANCHPHNQQEIKRKLKAGDIKLYSKTAFFLDILRARQWLAAQCASC